MIQLHLHDSVFIPSDRNELSQKEIHENPQSTRSKNSFNRRNTMYEKLKLDMQKPSPQSEKSYIEPDEK